MTMRGAFTHAPVVAFRGGRNYVHSTTLYKQIIIGADLAGLAIDGSMKLRVRRLVRFQPELHYSLDPASLNPDASATFSIQADGAVWYGAVIEQTVPVVEREPYDETPISSRALIDGVSIRIMGSSGMHPIEVIMSLTLLLHQRLFETEVTRKWYLAQLQLARPLSPEDGQQVQIEMKRKLGKMMTRSSVVVDDTSIGMVEFAQGPI